MSIGNDRAPHDEVGTPSAAIVQCRCGDLVRRDDSTHGDLCEHWPPADAEAQR